jgi:hypothetical protein
MGKRIDEQVRNELRGIDLGDKRLNARCQQVAADLAVDPAQSIPEACSDQAAIKGAYRLFANDQVRREDILKAHYACTQQRCQQARGAGETILMIQDTCYMSYAHHQAVDDLGPIGDGSGAEGLITHNTLAVSLEHGETLGLIDQQVWTRQAAPDNETRWQRRHRARESQCWTKALEAVRRSGVGEILHVGDRGEDIYEALQDVTEHRERFVIRASWNRRLAEGAGHAFEAVHRTLPLGTMTVALPARAGQKARTALITLRACAVRVQAPRTTGRTTASVAVHLVEALEEHPPRGIAALHWRLLTSEPIDTLEACIDVVQFYSRRWRIEEFHKALKTGCGAEKRELESRHGLEVFLAIADVISTFLVRLRDVAREGTAPATCFFTSSQLALLRYKFPRLGDHPSAQSVLRVVAQLGGFLGRKSDGHPGWLTLWRGMRKLLDMDAGFHMAKSILSSQADLRCG